MTVLIVDDEIRIRDLLKQYCLNESYKVIEAENGLEAIKIIKEEKIDIILLDIMMPKMDGIKVLEEIKDKKIPTIILSARKEEYDKLYGFDLGIDDYVTKPFSPKEVMARIKSIMKRYNKDEDKFVYNNLTIDYKGHIVYLNNEELKLTPKEYDLLVYFVKNNGVALSREALLSKIWGYDYFGEDRTIDTHIKMLRNNLGEYRDLITTVRSVGYKFEIK